VNTARLPVSAEAATWSFPRQVALEVLAGQVVRRGLQPGLGLLLLPVEEAGAVAAGVGRRGVLARMALLDLLQPVILRLRRGGEDRRAVIVGELGVRQLVDRASHLLERLAHVEHGRGLGARLRPEPHAGVRLRLEL
jgi:hypothetical protein